jgi:NADPH:quinone reductase-like Zn-dependent oxidoreductase
MNMSQDLMRQVWMQRRGEPSVLEVRQVPSPRPSCGQVRLRVAYAGVNFADVMMRRGLYPDAPKLPAVAGYEVSGTIDAVGDGVDPALQGRPAVAMCNFGGYSEQVCVPAALAWPLPDGADLRAAAAVPVNYLTAWQMVRVMAPVAPGGTVLVQSAGGGVGQAVVQICALTGVRVIGSASPSKHEELRAQGLAFVFDSGLDRYAPLVREATGGRGVEAALEPRNGRWILESYKCLSRCGHLVLFGFAGAATGSSSGILSSLRTLAQVPWLSINPIRLMNDNRSLGGVNLGRMWDEGARTGAWMEALLALLADGAIAPRIDSVFPFAEAARAHEKLEGRTSFGKILLEPGS